MLYTVALNTTSTLLFLSWGVPTEPVSEYVYFMKKKLCPRKQTLQFNKEEYC